MTNERKKRISELNKMPFLAQLDHRYLINKEGKHLILSNLSKKNKKKLNKETEKLQKKYSDILKKIEESGIGFTIDKFLRELAYEYTHRYASSGAHNQPLNFNYFEPFCKICLFSKSFAPYVLPEKEINHLFDINDFFDYLTSNKTNDFSLYSLLELPENKIFHFTTNGDILDFSYLNSEGREFVISGFSLIRRGNYLHWYLIGGELVTNEEWKKTTLLNRDLTKGQLNPNKKAFLSEIIKKEDYKENELIELEGTEKGIKTILAGEIDLISEKYLGKCIMRETENSFNIICDDPEILDCFDNQTEAKNTIEKHQQKINEMEIMWDLISSMFQLPAYFEYKVNIQKDLLTNVNKKLKNFSTIRGKGINSNYVTVPSIQVKDTTSKIQAITPPYYQTETNGHWRRLSFNSIGKDKDGNQVIGKTWINKKSTWRATKNSSKTIYVKSSIKATESKIKKYQEKINNSYNKNKIGVLYVLQCAAMKDEIYKVGWTSGTAEDRAEQLSNATGIPISFIVIKSWEHQNADALEKSVHAMLDPYRINERREFFQVKYKVIEKIIESEIKRLTKKEQY